MALSLQQLLTPSSEDESLASIIEILEGLGFAASSWQSGSIQRTMIQLLARLHSDASNTTYAITAGRLNDLATGDWLSLKSSSDFDNERIAAVATQVNGKISDPLNVGPQTIVLGQLVATDQDGNTYRNVTAGTILLGGTLTLLFEAEVAGGASIPSSLELATSLAGFVFELPVDAIQRVGADAESDSRLRERNKTKWSTLAYAAPADAYVSWALAASAAVTRAWVDDLNPRGPGTLDLYVAGPGGAVDPSVLVDVLDYIEGNVDGIWRRPLGSDLEVFSATSATVGITGDLYVQPAFDLTQVKDAVEFEVTALLQALPVGGTVTVAALYSTIMGTAGVRNVHLSAPASDTTVAASAVPVPAFSLTPQY